MPVVRFNSVEEFCAEIVKDATNIDRRIVRVTKMFSPSSLSTNIHHISVFATYSVSGQIVELRRYCGDLWGINQEQDDKVLDRAKEAQGKIEETCQNLGLELRPGKLEPDKA